MKKLRLAIIGQGRSGRNIHGSFYRSDANDVVDVVAVVELDQQRRERALAEYPGCEVLSDYKELLDRDDLDVVVNDSRKGVELTSLTTINFRVFRRAESCKVLLDCNSSRQNPSKIYLP